MKCQILVITGPTASGKSALAVELARKWNGEVISADSRQVYRGLDIGSGKITKRETRGVPHHLLSVASPKRTFTVAQYQKLANQKIEEIIKRGKLPIICGGTGFYIQAIIDDLVLPAVKPNLKLRKILAKKSVAKLFNILEKLDKNRAENIDKNNPRRLIRAIEIAKELGQVPKLKLNQKKRAGNYDFMIIGIKTEREELKKLIRVRLEQRLKSGLIREVKNLHEQESLGWRRLENFGLEYKFVALYLQKKMGREEMIERLASAIWQYAKRQLTWWRPTSTTSGRDARVHWYTRRQAWKLRLKLGNTDTKHESRKLADR